MNPSDNAAAVRTTQPGTYAVVLLYFQLGDRLTDTVAAVRAQTLPPVRIHLVDNCSGDGVVERLRDAGELDGVDVHTLSENLGYAAGMNMGAAAARADGVEHLLFLTHELVLDKSCAERLVRASDDANAAVAGPSLLLPDGSVWSHGGFIDARGGARHRRSPAGEKPRVVTWLDGACLLVRASDFVDCGGFDERFFLYWEDVDMCLRLAEHGAVLSVPSARAVQAPSSSSTVAVYYVTRNRLLFWRHRRRPVKVILSMVELAAWGVKRAAQVKRSDLAVVARGIRDGLTACRWA